MLHRFFDIEIRAKDEHTRSFDFTFSTAAIDSYDEVVEQDWLLERYSKNPVVLWNHNIAARGIFGGSPPESALPIGTARHVRVEDGRLVGTIDIASAKASPMADFVFHGLREGTLRATSVGFMPGDIRFEKRGGKELYVLSKNELHEISVVPVPANPEAVLRGARLEEMRALALTLRTDSPPAHRAPRTTSDEEKNRMELEKQLAEKATALLASEERVRSLSTQLAAVEAESTKLAAQRDEATARAKAAEKAVIVAEVKALVGVKITPAEEESFVELALESPKIFARMVSLRADLQLLGKESVLSKENGLRESTRPTTDLQSDVDDLNRAVGLIA